jgi:sarcosine oxidase subunit alpha
MRAQYFPQPGEDDPRAAISREAAAVRAAVGFCDVSTLGKIDIQGPDAALLLDRVYINNWSNLPVGRARYGVMLREDGIVLDDGTTTRLGEHHFIMTTTTANAARVYQHLEFCLQVLWPELEVHITSVTDQWAQVAVAGPLARDTIVGLVDQGFDLSDQAFPYMAAAEVSVMGGVSARLFRISYSGELAYELAVPARAGNALMDALAEAGRPWDIVPYGTEALGVLRIEKGHVGGAEINGQTTAADLGLGRMMSTRKDCIGRVLASRPGLQSASRASLAGFRPVDRGRRVHAGAHFIGLGSAVSAENDEGHMTSVTFSPAVDGWIGLGLIRGGAMRAGERVRACDPVRDGDVEVEICAPVFVDPDGERLRG